MRRFTLALGAWAILICQLGAAPVSHEASPLDPVLKQAARDGRPILAMGVRSTCPLCAAFKRRLTTDAAIRQLLPGFLPVFVDVDSPTSGINDLARLRPLSGKLPFLYVIRADDQLLAAATDVSADPTLDRLLRDALARAGRSLQPTELSRLQAGLTKAKSAIDRSDPGQALTLLAGAAKSDSYASVIVESRTVLDQIKKQAASDIAECEKSLKEETDRLTAALLVAEAVHKYVKLPEQRKALASLTHQLKSKDDGRTVFSQAEEIVRARGYARSHKKEQAAQAYERLIEKYPKTSAAKLAGQELDALKQADGGAGKSGDQGRKKSAAAGA